ncbi:MAG: hypothetical protein OSJ70_05085 [Bacilli bacterium]|nr:hypothetical protein [Bacilli bacterium]
MTRIEKRGNIVIFNNEYVIKEEKDLKDLENYLNSRDYHGFIKVLERDEDKNKYPYIKNYSLNNNQLATDLASSLALLHNKTSYNKEVNNDKHKKIYDDLLGYINYLEEKYRSIISKIEYTDFPSPSEILYLSNYTKLTDCLGFCKRELEAWFNLVKNKNKERVSLIHGNVRLEHAIYNDQLYLTSWRHARFETPIVDLIDFYHNEWKNIEFSSVLEKYFDKCSLLPEEQKLFIINISLPLEPLFKDDEFANVITIRELFDYIYKTEQLIRPYYTVENKE